MRVLLIAGHGAGDPGAVGNGYKESDLTIEMVTGIASLLKKYATAVIYPMERNAYKDIQSNNWQVGWNYEYVLEVHFNAGGGTGTEIYVTTTEKIITVEQGILKELTTLYKARGVKVTNFLVIKTCKNHGISSALLETCFIDNATDINTYRSKKQDIFSAVVSGIIKGFQLDNTNTKDVAKYLHIKNYAGTSIVDALKSISVDSSFANRKVLASKNGNLQYTGTAIENNRLLDLLKQGKLVY